MQPTEPTMYMKLLIWGINNAHNHRAVEVPMDTVSAYIPMRFCSSCCEEWGSVDIALDLLTRATGNSSREEVYIKNRKILAPKSRPCCTRALFPGQHNVESSEHYAFVKSSCPIVGECATNLTISSIRPRLRVGDDNREKPATLIQHHATLADIESTF